MNLCSKLIWQCSLMSFGLFYLKGKYLYLSIAELLTFFHKPHSWCIMIILNELDLVDCDYAHSFPPFSLISVVENVLREKNGHQYLNYCRYYYRHHYFLHYFYTIHGVFDRERDSDSFEKCIKMFTEFPSEYWRLKWTGDLRFIVI